MLVEKPVNANMKGKTAEEIAKQELQDMFEIRPALTDKWFDLCHFEKVDAARCDRYFFEHELGPLAGQQRDYSHIYSYNKVMSHEDRKSICLILNKTNFRMLAWYFGPKETEACGLKHVRFLHKMPMQSTGNEKFSVYIFYRTKKLMPG